MARLTLQQRARRRATKKNNQLRKKYPLFADQWLTTPEAEEDTLSQMDRDNEARWLQRAIHHRQWLRDAYTLRQKLLIKLGADTIRRLDRLYLTIGYPQSAEYVINYWRKLHRQHFNDTD